MINMAKFAYYQSELEAFRKGESVNLRRIQLDPIAGCNHDCPFCIYRYNRGSNDPDMNALFNESNILGMDKLTEIFEDCVDIGVKAIEVTGGGEPSLHPYFPEILKELNDRDIEIGLVTNGAWRDKHYNSIIEQLREATWVRFSLDAATPETHRITHASKEYDFDKAINAIADLTAHKAVTVGISFIVQKNNCHQIKEIIELGNDLNVDYVRIGGVMFEGERIEHIELSPDENEIVSNQLKELSNQGGVPIVNNFDDRSLTQFEGYNAGDTCYYSHLATVIGADAKIYACCIWKYRPAGVIGDLNKASLKDIWLNNGLDKFYENFDISEKCTRCYLKDKNDHIHSLVMANHINFV